MLDNDDIVTDILLRLADQDSVQLEPAERRKLEEEIRRDWGGERIYIAKVGECGRARLSERDACIRADHRRGEREDLLARRWGVSVKRVRQIVRSLVPALEATTMPAANDPAPARRKRRRPRRPPGNDLP